MFFIEKYQRILLLVALVFLLASCGRGAAPGPTSTPRPTYTVEPTATPEPTNTPRPEPSDTPTPIPLSRRNLEEIALSIHDLPGFAASTPKQGPNAIEFLPPAARKGAVNGYHIVLRKGSEFAPKQSVANTVVAYESVESCQIAFAALTRELEGSEISLGETYGDNTFVTQRTETLSGTGYWFYEIVFTKNDGLAKFIIASAREEMDISSLRNIIRIVHDRM